MRFPWLQVDADFIGAHAGDLGAHLGISRREALGLAIDLWTWALARARDDAPPDGVVTGTGPVPDRLLSGSVGWTGPAEQFTAALVAVGMAVRIEGGYRLTGFSRYKSTWEKNRRRAGEKPERNRTGSVAKPEPKTQTQTHIEDTDLSPRGGGGEQAALNLPGAAPAPKPPKPPKAPKPPSEPKGDPRHKPLVAELVAVFKAKTGTAYGFQGVDARKVTDLLALADQDPETCEGRAPAEIARRWGIGLDWAWPSGERPVQSLTALVQRWNECRELRGPGGPKRFVDASTANHPKEAGDVPF